MAPNYSHADDPIPDDGQDHGNSRRWGDASIEVKRRAQQKIIDEAKTQNLSKKDTANLIALAKVESGLNPDAATSDPRSSASGLFQLTDSTAKDVDNMGYDYPPYDRFNEDLEIKYGIAIYFEKKKRAGDSDDVGDIYKKYNTAPDQYNPLLGRLRKDSAALENDLTGDGGGFPYGPAPKLPKNPPLPPPRPAEFGKSEPSPFGGLSTDQTPEPFDPNKIDQLLKMYKYLEKKKEHHASAKKIDEDVMVVKGPDVCLTPKGGCMVPVGYHSVAHLGQSVRVAETVHVNSHPSFNLNSRSTTIKGHSPGTGRGQTVKGYEKYSHTNIASESVFSEGWAEVRNQDPAWINHPTVGPVEPQRPMESVRIALLYPLGAAPSLS